MMRSRFRTGKGAISILFFFGIVLLSSFLPLQKLSAEEIDRKIDKIPQRVYFAFTSPPPVPEEGKDKTLANLLEMYYTTVSSIQPIVRVEEREKAHAVVEVDWESVELGTKLTVTLIQNGEALEEHSTLYTGNMDSFILFLETSSEEFARHLDLVLPEIKLETRITDEKTEQMVEEVDFSEKLKRPFELTLYTSVFTRDLSGLFAMEGAGADSRFSFLPLTFDFTWYPWDNVGFYTSLFFDVTNADYTLYSDPAYEPKDVFLLPGFGVAYRTLDRIAGTFFFGYNIGVIFAQSGILFHNFFNLSPIVTFNITDRIAIRLRLNFGLDFFSIGRDGDFVALSNTLFVQLISLGFTYRP